MANVNARHFKNEIAFWNDLMAHETYDAFWQARNLRPHLKNIKPAVLTVGGWFDAEDLFGALETYKNVERQSPGATNFRRRRNDGRLRRRRDTASHARAGDAAGESRIAAAAMTATRDPL
jgi:predicted acyl esterase